MTCTLHDSPPLLHRYHVNPEEGVDVSIMMTAQHEIAKEDEHTRKHASQVHKKHQSTLKNHKKVREGIKKMKGGERESNFPNNYSNNEERKSSEREFQRYPEELEKDWEGDEHMHLENSKAKRSQMPGQRPPQMARRAEKMNSHRNASGHANSKGSSKRVVKSGKTREYEGTDYDSTHLGF